MDIQKFCAPGSLSIIFGDYGTGRSTFALQLLEKSLEQYKSAFLIWTSEELLYERLSLIFAPENLPTLENRVKIFKIDTFESLLKFISVLDFYLDVWKEYTGEKTYAPIFIDSFSRPYLLDQGTSTKNYQRTFQLSLACAWLKKIGIEKNIPIILTCEERVRNEEPVQKVIPAGGNVIQYWGDFFCHILRKTEGENRTFIFHLANDKKFKFQTRLTPRGFVLS